MNDQIHVKDHSRRMIQRIMNFGFVLFMAMVFMAFLSTSPTVEPAGPSESTSLGADPFIGEIAIYPYNFAPVGWAECAGQLLPISQNQALFSLLGSTYGGDGVQTFGLPDLRGRTVIGHGQGLGLPSYSLGQKAGQANITLTLANLPNHTHTGEFKYPAKQGPGDETLPADGFPSLASNDFYAETPTPNVFMGSAPYTTNAAGGNLSFNNMPPYQVLGYYIALVGIYPSQN